MYTRTQPRLWLVLRAALITFFNGNPQGSLCGSLNGTACCPGTTVKAMGVWVGSCMCTVDGGWNWEAESCERMPNSIGGV